MSRCRTPSAPALFLPLNPEFPATLPLWRVSAPRKPRDILCLARNPALCALRAIFDVLPTPLPWLRLACPISLARRGNLTNDHPRLAPERSRRRFSSSCGAKAPIDPPKVGIGSPSRPIFAATPPPSPETATASPESWVRSASRPYPLFTTGAAAPLARQRDLKLTNLKLKTSPPLGYKNLP
jgi:hypothetical protein